MCKWFSGFFFAMHIYTRIDMVGSVHLTRAQYQSLGFISYLMAISWRSLLNHVLNHIYNISSNRTEIIERMNTCIPSCRPLTTRNKCPDDGVASWVLGIELSGAGLPGICLGLSFVRVSREQSAGIATLLESPLFRLNHVQLDCAGRY